MCIVCKNILNVDEFVYGNCDGISGTLENICEKHSKEILNIFMDP